MTDEASQLMIGSDAAAGPSAGQAILSVQPYLTESVYAIVVKKSIPAQIR